ncbi:uncharacterized protein LOC128204063 [Mya arenaria]|uniref:uncharacterized protein LOC128204063 n=1 Tax=Mya arenaria TaxID=6604 RepID=UPI0022E7BF00|nr:uncharacterized protein LOC128204063 [Mya arenaria]
MPRQEGDDISPQKRQLEKEDGESAEDQVSKRARTSDLAKTGGANQQSEGTVIPVYVNVIPTTVTEIENYAASEQLFAAPISVYHEASGSIEVHGISGKKGGNYVETGEEPERRERTLSTSSTPEQRNRSLEALFKVTDNELQAIAQQPPGDSQHLPVVVHVGDQAQAVIVIDNSIQEREEMIGEYEEEEVKEENSETDSDVEDGDDQDACAEHEKHSNSRQYANIERILNKAGIDTKSKGWMNLTRPGKHICPYCQRTCSKPSVLEKHIRAHTGERPYPCLVCGFSFKTKSNLYKHCKSRAHVLKRNLELKKHKLQQENSAGLVSSEGKAEGETSGDILAHRGVNNPDLFPEYDLSKRGCQKEPVQRHVIQEVLKYLEKDKGERPCEVQNEKQRAKLERLKSVQEKKSGLKIQRQYSLPIMSSSSKQLPVLVEHVTPQPPIGALQTFDLAGYQTGFVGNMGSVVMASTPVNPSLQQTIHVPIAVQAPEEFLTSHEDLSAEKSDNVFLNKIEIVNLPDPDSDPVTATKALRDLEALSEKYSKCQKDGVQLSTSVRTLPDKRVQVVMQLVETEDSGVSMTEQRQAEKSLTDILAAAPTTSVAKTALSSVLKERIQQIISANEAIIDTPKVEPPRAKCLKRNLSRQDSEMKMDMETSISLLLPPSGPVCSYASQGSFSVTSGRITQTNQSNNRSKSVIVGKAPSQEQMTVMEGPLATKNVQRIDECMLSTPNKMSNIIYLTDTSIGSTAGKSATLSSYNSLQSVGNVTATSGKGALGLKLRSCLELPLTTTFLPRTKNPILASHLNRTHTVSAIASPSVTSVIMSPMPSSGMSIKTPITPATPSGSHVPGQVGKMALKNLQMRSKSLSSLQATPGPLTPSLSGERSFKVVQQSTPHQMVSIPQASFSFVQQSPSVVQQIPIQASHFQHLAVHPSQVQEIAVQPNQLQQIMVQSSPGVVQPQYVLQMPVQVSTPSIPMAQVLLPGSTMPVFVMQEPQTVQAQAIIQQPTVIMQSPQTPQLSRSSSVGFMQTPVQTQTQVMGENFQAISPVQFEDEGNRLVEHKSKSTSQSSSKSKLIQNVSSHTMHDPRVPQSTDPMKILSKIVSDTVSKQKLDSPVGKEDMKEIKIQIKFPPQQPPKISASQVVVSKSPHLASATQVLKTSTPGLVAKTQTSVVSSTMSSATVLGQRSIRPKILQRQDSVSFATVPFLASPSPLSATLVEPKKTPTVAFRFETPAMKSPSVPLRLDSPIGLAPIRAESRKLAPGTPTVSFAQVIKSLPQSQIEGQQMEAIASNQTGSTHPPVCVYVLQGKSSTSQEEESSLMKCPYCNVSFKKPATLELHMMCYCKKRRESEFIISSAMGQNEDINKDLVARLFTQSAPVKTEETKMEVSEAAKVQSLSDWNVKASTSSVSKCVRLKTMKAKTVDVPIQKSPMKEKDSWQSKLKGQILKRRLKFMLNRSMSFDAGKKNQISNKIGLKSRFDNENLYKSPIPQKHARLVRSFDDSVAGGIRIRRPVFKRSESVPDISKDMHEEEEEREEPVSKEVIMHTRPKDDWKLIDVKIPLMKAEDSPLAQYAIRPIYQQNFKMKAFAGMGTPLQFLPSATLTPRPDLMEIDKVKKIFIFDAKSLKLIAKTDAEKHQSVDEDEVKVEQSDVNGESNLQIQSKSPKVQMPDSGSTLKKTPFLHQYSLVGHTYPSMRSMTHLSFCTKDRLQPSYVKASKKVSMYSDWRVAPQNPNPLGLATKTLLSLYNSRYTTNPVWLTNCGDDPRKSLITHSSYWKHKQGEVELDKQMIIPEEILKKPEKGKLLQGGFKSAEAYVYVRGRGRGRYVCETCGIRCKKPSMLKKHIRSHTNLRPYKCKQCNFSFKTKGNLTKHMKSKSHVKKCMELGIYPIPMEVDDTHIDEGALKAQCSLSKQAKIVDNTSQQKSLDLEEDGIEVVEDDVEDLDDGGSDDGDDGEMDDRGDNSQIGSEDGGIGEDGHEDSGDVMDVDSSHKDGSTSGFPPSGAEGEPIMSTGNPSISSAPGTLPNLGPSSMADYSGPSTMTVYPGASTMSSFTGSSTLFSASVTQHPTDSSLMTIYGNLDQGEDDAAKNSDVIWGLLTLSDHTAQVTGGTANQTETKGGNVLEEVQNITSAAYKSTPVNSSTRPSPDRLIPTFLSLASGLEITNPVPENGPIIGQILKHMTHQEIDSSSCRTKSNVQSEAGFVPFHFQHPFRGDQNAETSMLTLKEDIDQGEGNGQVEEISLDNSSCSVNMTTRVITSEKVVPVELSKDISKKSHDTVSEQSGTTWTQEIVLESEKDSVVMDLGSGETQHRTVQAEIVDIDPAVFSREQSNLDESGSVQIVVAPSETWNECHLVGKCSVPVSIPEKLGKFSCSICSATFPESHQLILHGNVHLLQSSRIKCEKCSLKFRSHASYETHVKNVHSSMDKADESDLDVTNPRPYLCVQCDIAYRSKGHLCKHWRSKFHFTNLEMNGILENGTWEKLKDHLHKLDTTSEGTFMETVKALLGEVEKEMQLKQKVVVENIPQEYFSTDSKISPYNLPNVVMETPPLVEGSTFQEEQGTQLTKYLDEGRSLEKKNYEKITAVKGHSEHRCKICGITFIDEVLLKGHLLTHSVVQTFICKICDAGFTNEEALKNHLWSHGKEYPYVCGRCGDLFSNPTQLVEHCQTLHDIDNPPAVQPPAVRDNQPYTTTTSKNLRTATSCSDEQSSAGAPNQLPAMTEKGNQAFASVSNSNQAPSCSINSVSRANSNHAPACNNSQQFTKSLQQPQFTSEANVAHSANSDMLTVPCTDCEVKTADTCLGDNVNICFSTEPGQYVNKEIAVTSGYFYAATDIANQTEQEQFNTDKDISKSNVITEHGSEKEVEHMESVSIGVTVPTEEESLTNKVFTSKNNQHEEITVNVINTDFTVVENE